MADKAELPYKYSVFMSYAHDDDDYWAGWISQFNDELTRALPKRLGELRLPGSFLSTKNGPIHGGLNDALYEAIRSSFAMVVFVHDYYLDSPWCLQELQLFRELHGEDGFSSRLFIVAMSKSAIEKLSRRPAWLNLFPSPDPVWLPFHQRDNQLPDEPINMFLIHPLGDSAVMATDFLKPFFRLRKSLVDAMRSAADLKPDLFKARPESALPIRRDVVDVQVFIESEPGQEAYWEPLGLQVTQAWESVAKEDREQPPLRLRPTGLPLHNLRDRPFLDDADGVILLWDAKTQESLLAQIQMVEPKLKSPRVVPGLIAYLTDANAVHTEQIPTSIRGWPVVSFASHRSDPQSAEVATEDAPRLTKFLADVLRRKRES